jgi:hypothetical protein
MIQRLLLISILFLAACAPSTETIQQAIEGTLAARPTLTPVATYTLQPTYTALPTHTSYPTYTPESTSTPYPSPIPTETATPTPELSPTPTLDPIMDVHGPGNYLVNVDMMWGNWRSQVQGGDDCYWEIKDRFGDTISNYYGNTGGVIYIPVDAYEVQLDPNCGDWVYLGIPVR